jgi:hypothetical protein
MYTFQDKFFILICLTIVSEALFSIFQNYFPHLNSSKLINYDFDIEIHKIINSYSDRTV